MLQITLTDEQTQIVAKATTPVHVCDPAGNTLTIIQPVWTEADIAEAKRRLASDEPRYTTAEVLDHLRARRQT